jgi:putative ABC transport system permease protein
MILRSLVRWPIRTALTSLGLALAVAVLVATSFFPAALDVLVSTTFDRSNRQDAMLMFEPDIPETALANVAQLPGVLRAEGQQFQSAVLRNGHWEKDVAIEARRPGSDLTRIISSNGQAVDPPARGLMLSRRLADQLHVRPGDVIEVEFRGGINETHVVPVSGIVTQYIGLGAYMDIATLSHLLRQSPRISVANLQLDAQALPELHRVLKNVPELSGLIEMNKMRRSFETTIRQNIDIMTTIYMTVAVLITIGVAYNGARIQLSERARELASLRILGFSRGEVSFILVGETMIVALLAQPLGWLLGAGISKALADGSASDLYEIPLVLEPAGFARASLVVLAAALLSALVVRRRLDQLDLVQVMKTRE